ncbi:GDSL-type esterase/lipase family protein [Falsiroseomonas sp.]|uniref:GDSL-type esterase/lipase family protein n=1 Tax=Falsiroseomonas sp. TaxID=2870721 RepID=UPI003F72B491
MRRPALALALLAALAAGPALAAPGCPALPAPPNLPREAVPEAMDFPAWRSRVAEIDQGLARIDRSQAELVFLGDSLTQGWEPTMYAQFFGGRRALNLGVSGDFTQGLLFRLRAGQWGNLRPKLVVLLIGTNNSAAGSRPEDTALGIAEIIRFIHGRSPRTRILLVGTLPRGADRNDPLRAVNARLNALVARCADGQSTVYIEPGPLLLMPDGQLTEHVAFDRLHLTMVGYAILGAAITPQINRMLAE